MKETKIKQRVERAVEAFFDDEISEQNSMVIADEKSLSQKFHNSELAEKADRIYGFLKKAFVFLPGVLIMHFASISFAMFFNYEGVNLSLRLFWIAAASFMVWAGIGDLSNKKHLLIPVPTLVLGFIIGAALNYSPALWGFNVALLSIPLFFITPVLTRGTIDLWDENESRLTNPETML